MASGGHDMLQQRAALEVKLKTLINEQLKDICRSYGHNVSGTKATLQKRCVDILNDIIRRGDATAFEDMRHRANHKGQPAPVPLDMPGNNYSTSTSGWQPRGMAPSRPNAPTGANRLPPSGRYFKSSPFYEIIETVSPLQDVPDWPEMPQNRNTVKATINLSTEQCQRIASEGMRLLLFCGLSQGMNPYHGVDVAFPNQIEIKVNGDDIKANFKGLKNKPGSTKPVDVTEKFRTRPPRYDNQVSLTYALTGKRYSFIIYMVRHIKPDTLTERIKQQNVIPKQKVIDELKKANEDPDIEATSTRMSLKDPISTMRISLPVRSAVCKHIQCFDGSMFLQMMEQAPLWNCPICNKTISFQSLCVDKYFEDILRNTPGSIEKVDVEPTGEWRVIKEEEDEQPNGTSNKPRASYDDDFDDDLIEMTEPSNKAVNGLKSQPSAVRSSVPGSFHTPPLSSREPSVAQSAVSANRAGNKRPSGAVIDLTLSDEEDEQPPRPAKRLQTDSTRSQGNVNISNSYNTPPSIPDRHHDTYQPAQQPQHAPPISFPPSSNAASLQGADTYRPTSYPSRQASLQPFEPPAGTDGLGRDTQSPVARSGAPRFGAAGWSLWQSRPPSQSQSHTGIQPFSIRPPPSPGGPQSPPSGNQSGSEGFRLPPINQSLGLGDPWGSWQNNGGGGAGGDGGGPEGGWRNSDRGNSYSDSPL